ncbi:MAG TPA: DUF1440 domain-containing protein [Blastocatellia bacterium]|nr:DUF1440 domain-containing protein [Blastocatellia bacterium]
MLTRLRRRRDEDVLKGLLVGAISGLAASWVMNQFQAWLSHMAGSDGNSHGAQSEQQGTPPHGQQPRSENSDDDATERLAAVLSENIAGQMLTEDEKKSAGTALHYAFGVTTGAAYGAAAELLPQVKAGAGIPFGALVWLTADEGVVPALGLSKTPTDYPLSIHAYSLASHLVYGATTEGLRRVLRPLL